MVSSITPTGASAIGLEPRLTRNDGGARKSEERANGASGDAVELGVAARLASARESVRVALTQIQAAAEAGQSALDLVDKIRAAAADGADKDTLGALIDQLGEVIDHAVQGGARLLAGEDLAVQAEPDAAPVTVSGFDLRLGAKPGAVLAFGRDAEPGETLAAAAERSAAKLRAELTRLNDAARTLGAHQGILGAAAGSLEGVRSDLDADAARLLALQVRQGLDAIGGGAIVNVEPQAVLSLFRA